VIPRLWYISDGKRGTAGRPLPVVLEQAAQGGVGACVLREAALTGAALRNLARAAEPLRARGLRVLVSRRLDLVRACSLDGVHLAADAVPVAEARRWLGDEALIGYSAHSGEEARRAAADGASYVTLSPIYATQSKPGAPGRGPEWLSLALRDLEIPALALGGMTPGRTEEMLRAGAWGVAAVSAIGAAPDVSSAARDFARAIAEASG
jgi:thiamine-phosphate pyrophosphorylase